MRTQKPVMPAAILFALELLTWPAPAALQSTTYETFPGATVEERGDQFRRSPGMQTRIVPFSATVTFDLSAPSLVAVIHNAVLEGGDPFRLTVRSSSGTQLPDGTYRFTGDYLKELYPQGTQYGFDWRFSTSPQGDLLWNGTMAWMGGHIWIVTLADIQLVQRPRIELSQPQPGVVKLTWSRDYPDYILESSPSLPASEWTSLQNQVTANDNQFSVLINLEADPAYFRLRKP